MGIAAAFTAFVCADGRSRRWEGFLLVGVYAGFVAWYAFAVRYSTTTDLTPDQIYEIGLAEMARISAETTTGPTAPVPKIRVTP